MRRLHRLLKLRSDEQSVFCAALILLAAVRLCLWVVPFPTLHRGWSSILPRLAKRSDRARLPPNRIVELVAAASRCVPGAHCLPRAVAAQFLLAREGHLADIHIGVRKHDDGLEAHAWLEFEGFPLFENDAHLNGFTAFEQTIASASNVPKRLK